MCLDVGQVGGVATPLSDILRVISCCIKDSASNDVIKSPLTLARIHRYGTTSGLQSESRLSCRRDIMTSEQQNDLEYLIERSKSVHMTSEQVAEQRRSFAYGNSAFENDKITKEMVDEEARRIGL